MSHLEHTMMRQVTYVRERYAIEKILMPEDNLGREQTRMQRSIARLLNEKRAVPVRDTFKIDYDIVLRLVEHEVLPGIMEEELVDLRRVRMTGEAWMDVRAEHREAMAKIKTNHQMWSMPIWEPITARNAL